MKHDTSGGFLLINFRNPLMPGGNKKVTYT